MPGGRSSSPTLPPPRPTGGPAKPTSVRWSTRSSIATVTAALGGPCRATSPRGGPSTTTSSDGQPTAPGRRSRGSDSNGAKNNDLPGEPVSQTTVIEKPQGLRERPCIFAGSRFSITVLEYVFSNQASEDEFREGETPKDRSLRPSSLFFAPLLSEPHSGRSVAVGSARSRYPRGRDHRVLCPATHEPNLA